MTTVHFLFSPTDRRNAPDRPILRWLASRLAAHLDVDPSELDPTMPLAEMGVDSVHAISLVRDAEAHFDIDVDPTMIFIYPTLGHIAECIGIELADQHGVVA